MLFEVVSFQDKTSWKDIVARFKANDVYYFQEYCILYHLIGDGEPHIAYYEVEGNKICYPFIKREIILPFLTKEETKSYDITTPYGYGGPLFELTEEKAMEKFRKQFEQYCQNNQIISEFIRFHPLLKNHQFLEGHMDVAYNRETIYIDLNVSEADLLKKYHKNHKRNLAKAIKNGLQFKVFIGKETWGAVDQFYDLYKQTMDKLNASAYYYFSKDYIANLLLGLQKNSMIAAVFLEGQMISAALCMHEGHYLHYHLGCSNKQYLHLGANIFQFYKISLWGKDNGFSSFHLGGGYSERDSLFQFKRRFNPEGTLGFYIGRKIHDTEKYKRLVQKWEQYYSKTAPEQFFPAYRKNPQ